MAATELDKAAQLGLSVLLGRQERWDETRWHLRRLYHSTAIQMLLRGAALLNTALVVFDELFQCTPNPATATACQQMQEPTWVRIVELVALATLMAFFLVQVRYKGPFALDDPWLVAVLFSTTTSILTLISHYVIEADSSLSKAQQLKLERVAWLVRAMLRPVPLLHLFDGARLRLAQLFWLGPRVFVVFAMMMLFVCIFAVFGRLLVLDETMPGNTYGLKGNGFESLWQSFVTCFWWAFTNNGPAPGAQLKNPGYNASAFWAFFWTLYTIIQVFYMVQVVTATVYDCFTSDEGNENERVEGVRARCCAKIMEQLADGSGDGARVPKTRLVPYLETLSGFRTEMVFNLHEVRAAKEDFSVDHAGLLHLHTNLAQDLPMDGGSQRHSRMDRIRAVLRSPWTSRVFHVLTITNAITVLATAEAHLQDAKEFADIGVVGAVYVGIATAFCADLALTMAAFGPIGVLRLPGCDLKGRTVLSFVCIVLTSVHALASGSSDVLSLYYHMHAILLIHLIHAVSLVPAMGRILNAMVAVVPLMRDLIVANLCVMYSWAVFGVYLVGGEFVTSNKVLQDYSGGTIFFMNFNTVGTGIYTLFMAIYGNNMQQLAQPLFLVGGWPMLLAFISFYLFSTLVTANVLISALIDAQQQVTQAGAVQSAKVRPDS